MATATISASMVYQNGTLQVPLAVGSFSITLSGTHYVHNIQTMAITTAAALNMGGVTSAGYGVFINRDATNIITIGKTGASDVVSLKPGEVACFRLGTNAPYAVALVSACDLEYLIVSA